MTAQIAAYGRLVDDPQVKQTSKGTPMTLARMAVPLPCSQADDGTATMWLSVLAFGRQAEALERHRKGELLSVAGNMQISQWTGQNNRRGMMIRTGITYRFKQRVTEAGAIRLFYGSSWRGGPEHGAGGRGKRRIF
ncbi:single-stranded DNA-binding protein [Escherichia coli]|uniref:single-stranded DNA-binding protein n=1 Tax=Escherichia coli TaxID=562 RepID=UPI002980C004|nr:single-stranded DNA-binding protein [Escherichia coli]